MLLLPSFKNKIKVGRINTPTKKIIEKMQKEKITTFKGKILFAEDKNSKKKTKIVTLILQPRRYALRSRTRLNYFEGQ